MSHDNGDVPFEDQPGGRESAAVEAPTTEERTGPHPGSTRPTTMREDFGTLADEGRKLWEAVETKIVAPVIRSYPEMARHLGAASRELVAAYQAAVRSQEQVWREQHPGSAREKITVERVEPSAADHRVDGDVDGAEAEPKQD
jgi:hypothetical protein